MDWMQVLAFAIGGILVDIVTVYIWYKLANQKINLKNYRLYTYLIGLAILGVVLNFTVPNYFKMIPMTLALLVANYNLISKRLDKCIVSVMITQGIIMISESVIVLIAYILFDNYIETLVHENFGIVLLNFGVAGILLLSINTPIPIKIYNMMSKLFNNMKSNTLVSCAAIAVSLSCLFTAMSYLNFPTSILLLVNTLLIIFYVLIVIQMIIAQEKLKKINSKYETSLTSLKEYENIMDRYKVANHENKNQLLIIRNMVKAKDNKILSYIDKIVDNKIKDNENIFYKTSKIPEGGLRATIYAKVCKMNELKIDYILDISKDVRAVDLIKLGDDTILNICKIISVFLDNAIEAVESLENKKIIIELFVIDNILHIDISNNYENKLNPSKIESMKYTTKGDGHGYGLVLVTKILKEDNNLENEKIINKYEFTQRLKIKM